jgi:hypothetical protein
MNTDDAIKLESGTSNGMTPGATFCTRLALAGYDAFTIKAIMGHRDMKTTERYIRAHRFKGIANVTGVSAESITSLINGSVSAGVANVLGRSRGTLDRLSKVKPLRE